ncbi:MAG: HlyC/CorC family transporter [Acidiferrobacterales bacterium]
MNKRTDDPPSSDDDPKPSSPSLLERLSQALLGEPSNRQELLEVLRASVDRNLMDRDTLDMIEGAVQVSDMQARDIMIPRAQMDVVDRNQEPEQYLPMVIDTAHSRFPMVDGDKDKVIGILLAKDLLRYFHDKETGERIDIEDMLRPAVFIPESKRLNVLLREFRSSRNHMAIVVDEYGGVSGLVTIEDVLEQIVGNIEDEHDIDEDDVMILPRGNRHFVVKALLDLEEFNEHFGTNFNGEDIDTIGGLVLSSMGHLPKRGERVTIGELNFKVLRSDSRRVHLLEVSPAAPVTEAASS